MKLEDIDENGYEEFLDSANSSYSGVLEYHNFGHRRILLRLLMTISRREKEAKDVDIEVVAASLT